MVSKNHPDPGSGSAMLPSAVRMTGVVKRFGPNEVLHGVDLEVHAGKIHALVGENGAGKSTLMKILAGVHPSDEGDIELNGLPVQISSITMARRQGVTMVFQEFSLVPNLTVTENIFLGSEQTLTFGRIDGRYQRNRAQEVLETIQANVPPDAIVGELVVSERQFVEIAKALAHESHVLIFDEPTAPLGPKEVEQLFGVLRLLRDQGKAIIYISHRLKEVFEIADHISVLKDGNLVGTRQKDETSPEEIIRMMVGRDLEDYFPPPASRMGEPVLRVEDLWTGSKVKGVSFVVNQGEVVGVAGLEGSGMRELVRAIFGAEKVAHGKVIVDGRTCKPGSVRDAMAAGVSFVSDDRKAEGLILGDSVQHNIALPSLEGRSVFGVVNTGKERATVRRVVDQMKIQARSITQHVRTLSGGNQQKVLVGKWLPRAPKVLVMHEPTRGVDVGAKVQIYHLIREMAENGNGMLVASTDLMELIGLCDRILVLCNGQLVDEVAREEAEEEGIIAAASGHADLERQ